MWMSSFWAVSSCSSPKSAKGSFFSRFVIPESVIELVVFEKLALEESSSFARSH